MTRSHNNVPDIRPATEQPAQQSPPVSPTQAQPQTPPSPALVTVPVRPAPPTTTTTSPAQTGNFRPAGTPHDYKAMAEQAEELRRQVMQSRVSSMTTVQAIHVTNPVDIFRGEGIAWTQLWGSS